MKEKLASIGKSIGTVANDDDGVCALQQYEERITDLKKELKEVQNALLDIELEAGDPLIEEQDAVEKAIFECSLAIRKRLLVMTAATKTESPLPGTKLPKLEVPTFNEDILNWKSFWEQFCVSVHD